MKTKIRVGNECINSHLAKCELVNEGITYFSTKIDNGRYCEWTGGTNNDPLLKFLNDSDGIEIINSWEGYKTKRLNNNDRVIHNGKLYNSIDEFCEYCEDEISDLKKENPESNYYSWFTGNGYYCADNKDIFKNGGVILHQVDLELEHGF
ncbi:MAG TPA: hypothetical protein DHV26_00385 [Cytophagales bacterium]|nr:hypothetical protein [Cytophagales bacterium]